MTTQEDGEAMNEGGSERTTSGSGAGGDSGLGELADFLLENPWLNQALQVAFDARDRASQASAVAMRNLNVSSASEVDRLGRRLRALSERLETLEDSVDELRRELAELRRAAGTPPRP